MPGVILLLDEATNGRVEELWDALEREFGVAKGYPGALPHLTIHLAEEYDLASTRGAVEKTANSHAPLSLGTPGFGVFTGELPVVYIPVIRTRALDTLHGHLFRTLAAHCSGPVPYYAPEGWMPHVSVGQVNLPMETLPALLAWLARQPLSWDVAATALAIGENSETGIEFFGSYPLRG